MENIEQMSTSAPENMPNKEINLDLIKNIWIVDNDDDTKTLAYSLKMTEKTRKDSNIKIKHFIFSKDLLSSLEQMLKANTDTDKMPQTIFVDYILDPNDEAENGMQIVNAINELYKDRPDKPILIGFTSTPAGVDDFKKHSIECAPEKDYLKFSKDPKALIKETFNQPKYSKYIK